MKKTQCVGGFVGPDHEKRFMRSASVTATISLFYRGVVKTPRVVEDYISGFELNQLFHNSLTRNCSIIAILMEMMQSVGGFA